MELQKKEDLAGLLFSSSTDSQSGNAEHLEVSTAN